MSIVDIDRYRRLKQAHLAEDLRGVRRLYLDVNHWIELDRAAAGKPRGDHSELLERLRSAVSARKAICYLSDAVFLELMKQTEAVGRMRMASLMDELSLGVCLTDQRTTWDTEVARFLYGSIPGEAEYPPIEHLVWAKAGFILGFIYPTQTVFDAATQLKIQQGVFDQMWNAPLSEVVARVGDHWPTYDQTFHQLAAQLNRGNRAFAHEVPQKADIYPAELAGAVDLSSGAIKDTLEVIQERYGRACLRLADDDAENLRLWRNVIYNAVRLGPARRHLRQMHISASLHTAFRKDTGRAFEANDIYDFHHAGAAVAYADIFLTERALRHLVRADRLDELFDCKVACTPAEAIEILITLDL